MTDATPLYSGIITALNAVPPVNQSPVVAGGKLRQTAGTLTLTAAQVTAAAAGDQWAMVRVPTRAKIDSVFLTSDQLDSSTGLASDLGVFTPSSAAGPGVAVSATLWKSAASTFQAAVLSVDQSLAITAANVNKPLWQLAGASSDPGGFYDICFEITHAATTAAAGSVTLTVTYIDED